MFFLSDNKSSSSSSNAMRSSDAQKQTSASRSGFLSDNALFCNQWESSVLVWEGNTLEERFPHLSSDTQMQITAIHNAQSFTFGDSNNESSSVVNQSSVNKD